MWFLLYRQPRMWLSFKNLIEFDKKFCCCFSMKRFKFRASYYVNKQIKLSRSIKFLSLKMTVTFEVGDIVKITYLYTSLIYVRMRYLMFSPIVIWTTSSELTSLHARLPCSSFSNRLKNINVNYEILSVHFLNVYNSIYLYIICR